eukprot:Clim_evm43s128 gene=Clim_evmTU43s128
MGDPPTPPPAVNNGPEVPSLSSILKTAKKTERLPSVAKTNDDATQCKRSAVRMGYYNDPFIAEFCAQAPRREPLIHRGYTIRVLAIEKLTAGFIKMNPGCQIVNLGAGYDTLYWRLKRRQDLDFSNFVEVDFAPLIKQKAELIRKSGLLTSEVGELQQVGDCILKGSGDPKRSYALVGGDLNNWEILVEKLKAVGYDRTRTTLFLAECVFAYIQYDKWQTLLHGMADESGSCSGVVNYEPIPGSGAFGRVMRDHTDSRGCSILGTNSFEDYKDHLAFYKQNNWGHAYGVDLVKVEHMVLTADHRQHLAQLEPLDELEEWHLVLSHYSLVWSMKTTSNTGTSPEHPPWNMEN